MESHVLIPSELDLLARVPPLNSTSSPFLVSRLLETEVAVVAARAIPSGAALGPAQGTVRWGRLEVYSTLPKEDVSYWMIDDTSLDLYTSATFGMYETETVEILRYLL